MTRAPVLVLGVGNVLMSDDGVGPHVVQALDAAGGLPPDVETLDGATAGFALVDAVADREAVIVVDAIQTDQSPGTVHRLEVHPEALGGGGFGAHDEGVAEAFAAARVLGCAPLRTVVFGVEAGTVEPGVTLSPEVERVVPDVLRFVRQACAEVAP
jgi:hydrogenase maturation protease